MKFPITAKVAAATLLIASTASFAAGKNYKDEHVFKDQPCPPPAMLKDGFYVGAQVGYDSYRYRASVSDTAADIAESDVYSANGWLGGLFLGYGQNINEWFYLGAEAVANATNAQNTNSITVGAASANDKFQVNNSYGLGILPGVKVTDTLLGFVRLGWNWANIKLSGTDTTGASASSTKTVNGFNFGLGMETLLKDNWSLRTEFDHTWYNSINLSAGAATASVNPSDNQYTLGLIYHFA